MPTLTDPILIVDDSDLIRSDLLKALRSLGYKNIHEAVDGQMGLEKIIAQEKTGHPFSLVIADWTMPRLSGIDLLERVRHSPAIAATPFIILTVQNEVSEIMQAISLGVNKYLVKPFDPATLEDDLEAAVEHSKITRKD